MGVVTEVGASVKDLKAGDHAGVGCMVGCCGGCQACATGAEQFCRRIVWTYGSVDAEDDDGSITQGGYSDTIVVNRRYETLNPKQQQKKNLTPPKTPATKFVDCIFMSTKMRNFQIC